ncbi:MAG: hypothetical protein CVV44_20270 [Spirochaetae bacterium HGW-Spirochaetae-1]|jgi:hypothetical protein|nr:MAG: hypothetical protein CVV44_20270 [Spirochaetae bacterium HGW-Spirochaetae-1]
MYQINQFYWPINDWESVSFLPLMNLKWSEDMPNEFCHTCPMASYAHPLVETEPNSFRKLCTISVVKNGLLKLKDVFSDNGGCFQKSTDYDDASSMLGMV